MKKRIIPVWMLFAASGFLSAQANPSSGENYIYTKTNLSDPSLPGTPKIAETVQYFDGLGRPSQVVNVKASPSGKDLVTQIPYDPFGRQTESWLPAPMATSNGAIQSGVGSAAQTYYNDNFPFSRNNMEASPLNRVLSQVQPGSDWQQHPVGLEYEVNGGDVNKYTATYSYSTLQSSISLSGTYGENQLYKNTATDEDGNTSIEFKNKEGQTILIRKMLSAAEKADTYYVYNEYNQLAYVIPPLASVSGAVNQTILDQLCYQYKYDERNRLVEKKLPGKGWEYMVYDRQDRLVLSQDPNLGTASNSFNTPGWMFTKYDQFGRVVYTGFFASTAGRAALQTEINNMTSNSENMEARSSTPFTLNGMEVYYTKNAFPTTGMTVLSVNYYDTYPSGAPALPTQILAQEVITDTAASGITTKSLPLASFVKNIENNNWTKNYSWYDKRGRAVGIYSFNHLGGYTKTESLFDFSGVAQQTVTRHKRLSSDTEKVITENFQYDAQNRLLVHKHQVDSNPEEILTQNTYNDLSQITSKKVGEVSVSASLQNIDYAYNIRGWMTQINDPQNLGSDLFGYKINYTVVEGMETPNLDFSSLKVKPKFNGNIAETVWKTSTVPGDHLRRYGYVYDGLNRLLAGFYQKDINPSAKEYFEKMDYDLNGNITNLKRSAYVDQGNFAGIIDILAYTYTGNRLNTVTDSSTDYRGYPDTSGTQIEYDNNANINHYQDKGILNITYNYLNLPSNIIFYKGLYTRLGVKRENTSYLYRADGIKLRKTYNYAPFNPLGTVTQLKTKTTEYLDGFQYESGESLKGQTTALALKFIFTAEGYYNFENNKYIYNYTDHLGNVRLSYFNNGSSIEVLEENNYYPFGMKHEGYNVLAGNPAYKYGYNGKELQTESGMHDYGARFYMADIGRWGVVDPLAEQMRRHSPYNYAFNNPIRFIDPDGMQNYDITFGKSISADTQNKIVSDLEKETGLKLSVGSNGKLSYTETSNMGGSETARNMLKGAIDNHRTDYHVNSDNTRGSSIQEIQGRGETIDGKAGYTHVYDLNINTDQIDNFIAGTSEALNPLTMGYGMVTLHEVSHKYNNLIDGIVGSDGKEYPASSIYGVQGDNVKKMNIIRTELDASGNFTLPFGQRRSYSPLDEGGVNFHPFSSEAKSIGPSKVNPKKDLFIKTPYNKFK
ncbi:DUF6443 domain-containing protein [uncultured Chryseobacterium sp.]|uniref:DUF6443 domain-containing protein n=1 Tax=uncultured Chryseobacterium sp. TaxID=259322 RepID=UPI0025EFFABD|nr:DUF6443 domain-containing protein [uncultured Chryseobacterium sp.]